MAINLNAKLVISQKLTQYMDYCLLGYFQKFSKHINQ